jgi:SAM-dependent methyltransferase
MFGKIRILWRDFVIRASDATICLDDLMRAYFFPDTAYQYLWSKKEVHQTLLRDGVRMRAFKDAIRESVKPGDTVLDVGTGSGILAFLAGKAGAGKVTGVDSAEKVRVHNQLDNVTLLRADIRDVNIQPVDLIICELIGMEVTDEGIIGKVGIARKFLKDGGAIMPSKIDICSVPVETTDIGPGFWQDIMGVDYSCVTGHPTTTQNLDLTKSILLSEPEKTGEIDFISGENKLQSRGVFTIERGGLFHGMCMYFEAKLSDSRTLSTSPREELTHWKQIFLPAKKTMNVRAGDKIAYEIKAILRGTKWKWKYSLTKDTV